MSNVSITGTVGSDGAFRPGWWRTTTESAPPTTTENSDWSVEAVDADGTVLATTPARVAVSPCSPDNLAARLRATLPLPPDSAFVVVKHAGAEAHRCPVPPAGDVQLDLGDAAAAAHSRTAFDVPVRITGPIGSGSHLIAVWESPSQPPLPIGLIDLGSGAAPNVRVDLDTLPGGDPCRLRVVYGDGVRTTEVVSGPLTVRPRPAAPVIESPAHDHVVSEEGWLSLHGRLQGDGDPSAMEWLLDGTPIGRGPRAGHARPQIGRHILTLRHGDESASVPVTVTAAPAPIVAPPWQPPWRSRPLTVFGRPAPGIDFGKGQT